MSNPLFNVPSCAAEADEIPAGGFGGGHFTWTAGGAFRHLRLHPRPPERDESVAAGGFFVWARQGPPASAHPPYAIENPPRVLFPFTWTSYFDPGAGRHGGLPLQSQTSSSLHLESLAFSPLLPGSLREASLPVYVVVFRAHNPTDEPLEAALLLTW